MLTERGLLSCGGGLTSGSILADRVRFQYTDDDNNIKDTKRRDLTAWRRNNRYFLQIHRILDGSDLFFEITIRFRYVFY